MDKKTKKIFLFLGALFVAVIFLSSYGSFGNNRLATSSTTTVASITTYPVFGSSTATITGYFPNATITFNSSSSGTGAAVMKTLSELQANGSISYYDMPKNGSYTVILSEIDAYSLQVMLNNAVNSSNAIVVSAETHILLPSNITLYYKNNPVKIYLNNRNKSVSETVLRSLGSKINVSIQALVTNNGTLYENELSVSPK